FDDETLVPPWANDKEKDLDMGTQQLKSQPGEPGDLTATQLPDGATSEPIPAAPAPATGTEPPATTTTDVTPDMAKAADVSINDAGEQQVCTGIHTHAHPALAHGGDDGPHTHEHMHKGDNLHAHDHSQVPHGNQGSINVEDHDDHGGVDNDNDAD